MSKHGKPAGKGDSGAKKDTGKERTNPGGMKGKIFTSIVCWNIASGEADASKRSSSKEDATTTSVEQFPGHEEFSKEIREKEAKGALD